MPAKLLVKHRLQENASIREFECGSIVTIGRVEMNDLPLEDPKISRSHATVRSLGDGYYVIDTGSANGTYVNGKRVVVPFKLSDSDRITMGDHELVFVSDEKQGMPETVEENDAAMSTLLTVGSTVQKITVLVTDIRNYTKLSEKVDVDLLGQILGQWFRKANDIVEANGGVIDKFIGDAIMALWVTNEREAKNSVVSALKAANDFRKAITEVSDQSASVLPFRLSFGVGVNTGQAILGNIGVSNKRDYTAIGDSVNLAFRFEAATRTLGTDVAMGPGSYKLLPESAWENHLRSVTVKGKDKPINVCTLSFDELEGVVMGLSLPQRK
jgi:adenylate cyclase